VFTAENVQLRCLGIAAKASKYSAQTCQLDSMDKKYAALSVWLLATTVFGALGGYSVLRELVQFYNLSKINQTASGEIIETYPRKHSTCKYRFSTGNRFYENFGRSCGKAPIGKKIIVYFSPGSPDKSVNEDPQLLFIDDLALSVLGLVCFPALAAYVIYKSFASTSSIQS
jgi:hypothetical protein